MAEPRAVTPAAAAVSGPSITLREYVDIRFEAQKEAVNAALAAAQKAVEKAEAATERRFENSNEWRNTVETLQRTYMPRTESEQTFHALEEKIDALTTRVNTREDRGAGLSQGWVWLVGGVAVIGTILGAVTLLTSGT